MIVKRNKEFSVIAGARKNLLLDLMPEKIQVPQVDCTLVKQKVGGFAKFLQGSHYGSSVDYTVLSGSSSVGTISLVENDENLSEVEIRGFDKDILKKNLWGTHLTPILKSLISELKRTKEYTSLYANPMEKEVIQYYTKAGFKPKPDKGKYEDFAMIAKI
jgi:hypothetical protein